MQGEDPVAASEEVVARVARVIVTRTGALRSRIAPLAHLMRRPPHPNAGGGAGRRANSGSPRGDTFVLVSGFRPRAQTALAAGLVNRRALTISNEKRSHNKLR